MIIKDYKCHNCQKDLGAGNKKYCNNQCQRDYEYKSYIKDWKAGLVSGSSCKGDEVSNFVRRYIMEKYNKSCQECGCNKINPFSNSPVVQIEHKNGISGDCSEKNLTLLCPTCHAMTSTYGALNKGNGRSNRRNSYIKKSDKKLVKNK